MLLEGPDWMNRIYGALPASQEQRWRRDRPQRLPHGRRLRLGQPADHLIAGVSSGL